MSVKLVGMWILGAAFLFAGVWIISGLVINSISGNLGVSDFSFGFAALVSFILMLLAGLSWISVAVATRHG